MFFEKTASAPFKFEYLQNGRIKTSTEERKWEKELLKKNWIMNHRIHYFVVVVDVVVIIVRFSNTFTFTLFQ